MATVSIGRPDSPVWGPFGARRLSLRIRLIVWISLAVVFGIDVVLAFSGAGVTARLADGGAWLAAPSGWRHFA